MMRDPDDGISRNGVVRDVTGACNWRTFALYREGCEVREEEHESPSWAGDVPRDGPMMPGTARRHELFATRRRRSSSSLMRGVRYYFCCSYWFLFPLIPMVSLCNAQTYYLRTGDLM